MILIFLCKLYFEVLVSDNNIKIFSNFLCSDIDETKQKKNKKKQGKVFDDKYEGFAEVISYKIFMGYYYDFKIHIYTIVIRYSKDSN